MNTSTATSTDNTNATNNTQMLDKTETKTYNIAQYSTAPEPNPQPPINDNILYHLH